MMPVQRYLYVVEQMTRGVRSVLVAHRSIYIRFICFGSAPRARSMPAVPPAPVEEDARAADRSCQGPSPSPRRARSLGASGMQLLPFREHLNELGDATGARLGFLGVLDTEQNSVTVA